MSKIYQDVCPCKDCTIRTSTCHSICKEYIKWQKSGIEIEKRPFFEIKTRRKK